MLNTEQNYSATPLLECNAVLSAHQHVSLFYLHVVDNEQADIQSGKGLIAC